MIKTDHVRAQAAVQAFDFTEKLAEFGFSTGTRADVDAARALITEMVNNADTDIERIIRDCEELGQNPYKRSVAINGREFKVAMEFPLFSDEELTKRIDRAFKSTRERNPPRPDAGVLSQRITERLTALMKDAGYDVCGIEHTRDGSPLRIVLRDPVYATEAMERDGGEPPVQNIAALGATLREIAPAHDEPSAEALGLKPPVTAEQVMTVRSVVTQVVDDAEHELMRHIQALKASGVSPYAEGKLRIGGEYVTVHYVDKALAPWRFGRRVDKPIVIESIDDYAITRVLQTRLPNSRNLVDSDVFCLFVRKALVARLRGVPDLPLAAVTSGSSSHKLTLVLVSPDAFARSRQSTVARLLGRTPPVLALPAPAVPESVTAPAEAAAPPRAPAPLPSTNGGFAVPR